MPDQIDALLGLDIRDEDQARALARQLRDERDFNQYFSETSNPDVNESSLVRLKRLNENAKSIGTRRYDMGRDVVTDTRNVATDKRAAERLGLERSRDKLAQRKYDEERANRGELEGWIGADDIPFNAYRDASGQYFMVDGTPANMRGARRDPEAVTAKGYIPSARGGRGSGKTTYAVDINGVKYFYDIITDELTNPATGQVVTDPALLAQASASLVEHKGDIEEAKALKKGFAEEAVEKVVGLEEVNSAMGQALNYYDEVFNAVAGGARSGKAWEMTPTFRESTAALQSAADSLALQELSKHKLTPISDKDIEYVKSAAMPNLYGAALQKWVTHKKEATRRMMDANELVIDYTRQNGKIAAGPEKAALEAKLDRILHGGGFQFAFDIGAAQGGEGVKRFTPAQKAAYDAITDPVEKEKARKGAVAAGFNP